MADEATTATAAEPSPTPDIDTLQAEAVAKGAPRTVEDFARERGWKPKEEYDGPEEGYRDPEQFLSFGLDRNRDLLKSLRSVEERLDRTARTTAQIAQDAADKARAEERAKLEAQHRRAVEEGDVEGADKFAKDMAKLAEPKPNGQNGQAQESPNVLQFRRENDWFDKDADARALAVAVSYRLAAAGATEAEQLQAAKEAVHKRFPEYAPAKAKAAPGVAQPGSRAASTRGRGKGFADMPAEAQEACRELVKLKLSTQEGYVKHYWNEGEAA